MKSTFRSALMGIALAAGMALVACKSTPANATGLQFTGCNVAGTLGYAVAVHDAAVQSPLLPVSLNLDSLSAAGHQLGVGVDCGADLGGGFAARVFGDWTWQDLEQTNTLTFGGTTAETRFAIGDAWTMGAHLGYSFQPGAMVYVLAGYSWAKAEPLSLTAPGFSSSFKIKNWKGPVLGLGSEIQLRDGWSLRGEYRATFWQDQSVALIPGALNFDLASTEHAARLSLVFKLFGRGAPIDIGAN